MRPHTAKGIVNGALQFNGDSTKIDALDDQSLYFGANSQFTIRAWVNNINGLKKEQSFIGKYRSHNRMFYSLGINKDNKVKFIVHDDNNTTSGDSVLSAPISDFSWHHVVGIITSTKILVYVDGVLTEKTVSTTNDFFSWDPLTIGYYYKNTNFFGGLLDELALYKRVLTAQEVQEHYERGKKYGKNYFDPFVLVKTKIFLEGPYNNLTGSMDTLLSSIPNTLPLTSPYPEDPRTVEAIPTHSRLGFG